MNWQKWLYQLRNWRAHFRALFLGSKIHVQSVLRRLVVKGTVGFATAKGELAAILYRADGSIIDLGVIARRVVTDAGVAFLVDDWDGGGATNDITLMNFHDSGTGTNAENATDTDLQTPAGPTTRATGTKSQPAANQFRSVGTISYTSSLAITEHGIFNQAARGAGTVLWDRSVFSAINVANGDSIQFTYTCTVNAGG